MRRYADVRDGTVRAIIASTRAQLADRFGGNADRMVIIPAAVDEQVEVGWGFDGEQFVAPAPRPPISTEPPNA